MNNFEYSAEGVVCDGKSDNFFNMAYIKAYPITKDDTELILKSDPGVWTVPLPFYVTLTGDAGVEKVMVRAVNGRNFFGYEFFEFKLSGGSGVLIHEIRLIEIT